MDTFSLQSEDGTRLYGRVWTPPDESGIRAALCILHDLGEHCGRYQQMAAFLNRENITVIGVDIRGHGKSDGIRGFAGSIHQLMDDLSALVIETRKRYLNLPIFLFGHGMGGHICARYILENSSREICGAILSSPCLDPGWQIKNTNRWLPEILYRFFPGLTFKMNIEPFELSKDPEIAASYLEDPYVHRKISMALLGLLRKSGRWVMDNIQKLHIPVLLYYGTADIFISIKAIKSLAENGGPGIQLKEWDGLYHEPHNEKGKRAVFNYLNSWMSGVLNRMAGKEEE